VSISPTFYDQLLCALIPKAQKEADDLIEFLRCWDLRALKLRVKLTPGLDFINVLRTAFTPVVPQSIRTQSSCQYLFMLLGPTSVKAVRRTLMKLTPGVGEIILFVIKK